MPSPSWCPWGWYPPTTWALPKGKDRLPVFQPPIFRRYVSFREGCHFPKSLWKCIGGIQHVIYFGLCDFLHVYYGSPIHSKKWCVNIAMYSTVCISRHATSSPVIAYLNPWAPILYPQGHPPGERRLGSGLLPQIRRVSRGSGVPGRWAHGVGWLGMDELKFWGHVFSWNKAAFSWSFFPTYKTKRKSTQFGYEISDNSRTQDFPRFKMKTEDGKTAGKSDIVSHTHTHTPFSAMALSYHKSQVH